MKPLSKLFSKDSPQTESPLAKSDSNASENDDISSSCAELIDDVLENAAYSVHSKVSEDSEDERVAKEAAEKAETERVLKEAADRARLERAAREAAEKNEAERLSDMAAKQNHKLLTLQASLKTAKEKEAADQLKMEKDVEDQLEAEAEAHRAKIREQLVQIYKNHAPARVQTVDTLLKSFKGREDDLLAKVKKKYLSQTKPKKRGRGFVSMRVNVNSNGFSRAKNTSKAKVASTAPKTSTQQTKSRAKPERTRTSRVPSKRSTNRPKRSPASKPSSSSSRQRMLPSRSKKAKEAHLSPRHKVLVKTLKRGASSKALPHTNAKSSDAAGSTPIKSSKGPRSKAAKPDVTSDPHENLSSSSGSGLPSRRSKATAKTSSVTRKWTPSRRKKQKPRDVGEIAEKIKNEIRVIFRKHAPSKLLNLSKLMSKFRGREERLLEKIKAKYLK